MFARSLHRGIRQNYFANKTPAVLLNGNFKTPEPVGQTLGAELVEFAKDTADAKLPEDKFGSWQALGQYYEHVGKASFFNEHLSGGAALARLLKECQASVRDRRGGNQIFSENRQQNVVQNLPLACMICSSLRPLHDEHIICRKFVCRGSLQHCVFLLCPINRFSSYRRVIRVC